MESECECHHDYSLTREGEKHGMFRKDLEERDCRIKKEGTRHRPSAHVNDESVAEILLWMLDHGAHFVKCSEVLLYVVCSHTRCGMWDIGILWCGYSCFGIYMDTIKSGCGML